ncbi:MAG: PLP-dependent transferase [Eubacteriaceae bacterium]|jgi:lysine decarboxylase|nr:PLP-dependent transferase [Eubacteriaceae bacterium]
MPGMLHQNITGYIRSNPARWHVPAHKGRGEGFVNRAYDITELSFSDNMNYPASVWLQEQRELADIFGTKHTLLSTNGSSAAVIAAMCSLLSEGGQAIVGDNCHISAYYGALHSSGGLVKARSANLYEGPGIKAYKKAYEEAKRPQMALIVSPNYYGISKGLNETISFFHSKGLPVVVDEAHGAHLLFGEGYPKSALELGADIVIHSAFKTINGPTQTAFLHCCTDMADIGALSFWLRSVHTTSPSYALALDALAAAQELKTAQNKLSEIKEWYNYIAGSLEGSHMYMINNEPGSCDYMKLPVSFALTNMPAESASRLLEEKRHIYAEMASGDIALFCAGLNSTRHDYEMLASALSSLKPGARAGALAPGLAAPHAFQAISMREALRREYEYIDISQAHGRISADFLGVYPPGSPIAAPGDILDEGIIGFFGSVPESSRFGAYGASIKVVRN